MKNQVKHFKEFINETKSEEKAVDTLKQKFIEFDESRLMGATKIAEGAKERGGNALLTYNHFVVKLPYYKKDSEGNFDLDDAKKEYKDLLEKLYSSTKNDMDIEQIAFQELLGKMEVLGELIIKDSEKPQ